MYKKKQKNKDDNADGPINKSEKVSNIAKLLEENMQKKKICRMVIIMILLWKKLK